MRILDGIMGWLNRLANDPICELTPIDRRPRKVVNCRCPNCGLTQLLWAVPNGKINKGGRQEKKCGCGSVVSAYKDAVGPVERII